MFSCQQCWDMCFVIMDLIFLCRFDCPKLIVPTINKFFYMHHPTDGITHTMALVTPAVEHWLEQEIAQWAHHERSIRRHIARWVDTLPLSYISLLYNTHAHKVINKNKHKFNNIYYITNTNLIMYIILHYKVTRKYYWPKIKGYIYKAC